MDYAINIAATMIMERKSIFKKVLTGILTTIIETFKGLINNFEAITLSLLAAMGMAGLLQAIPEIVAIPLIFEAAAVPIAAGVILVAGLLSSIVLRNP